MTISVEYTDDAAAVLASSRSFLESHPVEHNLLLTLLSERIADPVPGNYWRVTVDDETVGVAFQSPTHFRATLTPLLGPPLDVLVESIAARVPTLPGVHGEAGTVAAFAGHWAETQRVAAFAIEGQRFYRLHELLPLPHPVGGATRLATEDDLDLVGRWIHGFHDDIGEQPPLDPIDAMQSRITGGRLWIWDDDGPRSMVGCAPPVAGVARVAPVYTPPESRRNGYAAACTAAVTRELLRDNTECVLYTHLANPTSNAVYRSIGYEPVQEILRYDFGARS